MKAKLPNEFNPEKGGSLSSEQAEQARWIIRQLTAECEDEPTCCASAPDISVARGRLVIGARSWSIGSSRTPVGSIVCRAFEAGILPAALGDAVPDDPRGSGKGEGEGDAGGAAGAESGEAEAESGEEDEGKDGKGKDGKEGEGEGEEGEGEGEGEAPQPPADPEGFAANTLLERLWQLREACNRGAGVSDIVSTRTVAKAARLHFLGGFPDDAIIHALALNWSPNVRESLGILPVEPGSVERRPSRPLPEVEYSVRHEIFDYVLGLAQSRVGALLIGDAGSGKSYLCKQLASVLDVGEFRAIPLCEDISIACLLGRHTPDGFIDAPLPNIYANGGVYLFDELDAADSNALLVVNDALENGFLENPLTGERITRHPDFVPVAAANTYGRGADGDYQARKPLDLSTLDRWRLGRVKVGYDPALERHIFGVAS